MEKKMENEKETLDSGGGGTYRGYMGGIGGPI